MKGLSPGKRYGIIGTQGSGKSNSAWVLLNELRVKAHPIVILDHKGEYSTVPGCVQLKASQTGASALPLRLRNSNVSTVIDLRGHPNNKAWVRDFITACLRLNRRVPMLVVIEEAHNYVPQKGKADGCRQAVNNLASEGRSLGYGLVIISQRCSKIDKDALTQCDALFIHNHHFKTDLDYLEDFIGKERRAMVQQLGTGQVLHLDMAEGYTYETFQMPKAPNKPIGGTPEPQKVQPNYNQFYAPLPGQYPRGVISYADYKPSKALAAVVIIVVVVAFVLAYLAYRGMNPRDGSAPAGTASDAEEMPF